MRRRTGGHIPGGKQEGGNQRDFPAASLVLLSESLGGRHDRGSAGSPPARAPVPGWVQAGLFGLSPLGFLRACHRRKRLYGRRLSRICRRSGVEVPRCVRARPFRKRVTLQGLPPAPLPSYAALDCLPLKISGKFSSGAAGQPKELTADIDSDSGSGPTGARATARHPWGYCILRLVGGALVCGLARLRLPPPVLCGEVTGESAWA